MADISETVNDVPPITRYCSAVAICNSLALLASQGSLAIYTQRIVLLRKILRLWTKGKDVELSLMGCADFDSDDELFCLNQNDSEIANSHFESMKLEVEEAETISDRCLLEPVKEEIRENLLEDLQLMNDGTKQGDMRISPASCNSGTQEKTKSRCRKLSSVSFTDDANAETIAESMDAGTCEEKAESDNGKAEFNFICNECNLCLKTYAELKSHKNQKHTVPTVSEPICHMTDVVQADHHKTARPVKAKRKHDQGDENETTMDTEFIISAKGRQMLVLAGYLYYQDRKVADKESWRCSQSLCKGRCHTRNGVVIKGPSEHCHAASTGDIAAKRIKASIRDRSAASDEPPAVLLQNALRNLDPSTQACLPQLESLKRSIRGYRRVPKAADAAGTVPNTFKTTLGGAPFLRHDQNFLLFAADEDLKFLAGCSTWLADGTFKVCPSEFVQLYTIHGTHNGFMMPCVYALLRSKSEEAYELLLSELLAIDPTLKPNVVIMDFEKAAMNAFATKFACQIHGCCFHFAQCLWRKVQEHGYAGTYNTDEEFARHIRMLVALAYVPNTDKDSAFDMLINLDTFPDVEPIVHYFKETFLGRKNDGQRIPAIFPQEIWDCFTVVQTDLPHTNNSIEGWHFRFASSVSINHLTIPKLCSKLQKEQDLNKLQLERNTAGFAPPHRQRKYRERGARLRLIVNDYNNRDIIDYLRSCSHQITM